MRLQLDAPIERIKPCRLYGRRLSSDLEPDAVDCVISATQWNFCEHVSVKNYFCCCLSNSTSGGWAMKKKSLVLKRSIDVGGHKTSISLEDDFWRALKEIAFRHRVTLSDLIGSIDSQRQHGNLSSAVRLFVLNHYRQQNENAHQHVWPPKDTQPGKGPDDVNGSS
jgi:predicted DNA-binding ribbon-helix-helix protein